MIPRAETTWIPHDADPPEVPHDDEEELQQLLQGGAQQQHLEGHWDAPAQ